MRSRVLAIFILAGIALPYQCGAAETAPFYLDGRETGIRQAPSVIAEKRKRQTFPVQFPTKVPPRLQPLAVDFAAFFASSKEKTCGDFTVGGIEDVPTLNAEKWTIVGCAEQFTYLVSLGRCNNLLGAPLVTVKRESDGRTLAGANPLDATFLVSCPDL